MYIRRLELKNIRSISDFSMVLEPEEFAGWHVLIGDNGAGKSTLARAIALALVGPSHALALRQSWSSWLRRGANVGEIDVEIDYDQKLDKVTGSGQIVKNYYIALRLRFVEKEVRGALTADLTDESKKETGVDPFRYVWGDGEGWFSASYGPFRRFSGGNKDFEKLYYADPKLAPHLSAFGEDVALTECLEWLQYLHVKQLEGKPEGRILEDITHFINESGLLPHETILEDVSSDAVVFRDGNNCSVSVEQLSDGYRSILSMTFELVRQMTLVYGPSRVFRRIRKDIMEIDLPGVVVIDEIDAHLHPSWQRRIGPWFRRFFPKIQFIVTTHSPLVCQAAEVGTVWRLPPPGTDPSQDEKFGRVTGVELDRLMYGSIMEAFDTGLFGEDISRSESSKDKMMRLAILNRKKLHKRLTTKEEQELEHLRATLPTIETVAVES